MKIASPEWCAALLGAVEKDNEVYNGFADPQSFSAKVEFIILPDTKIYAKIEKGRFTYLGAPKSEEVDLSFVADADTWKSILSGKETAAKMVTMGKMKLQKGPLDLVIKNLKALEAFCRKMGQIPAE